MLADASFIGFIPVRDLPVARGFYEGTLGLRVVDDTPFALVLDAGGTMLRVTPGGDRIAWFTDPDGNTLSLTTFAAP